MSSQTNAMDQSEIRLLGLILMQSATVGLAVGIFDADMWIDLETPSLNGFTYAMGAFFVQGIAYYIFKMFFQQGMDEKARSATMERERRMRYRGMEETFERRRQDMELRMQEAQLEAELRWMEQNPGKMPPMYQANMFEESTADFNPEPKHEASVDEPLGLGVTFGEEKKEKAKRERNPDGTFKNKK